MATKTKTITSSVDAPLAVALVQPDASVVPVTVTIKTKVGGVLSTLASQLVVAPTAETPSRGGTRIVAYADVPGASEWEVTADTGVSPEALDLNLISGPLTVAALTQPFLFVAPLAPSPPGSSAQVNSETWVGPNGNDATGQRGNNNAPFRTIGAALNALQNGDTLVIGPDNYNETLNLPAGLDNVTFLGLGNRESCKIFSNLAAAISLNPSAGQRVTFENLTLQSTAPGASGVAGSGSPAAGPEVNFKNCILSGGPFGVDLAGFGAVRFDADCTYSARLNNCNSGQLDGLSDTLDLGVDEPIPPGVLHQGYSRDTGETSALIQRNNAKINFGAATKVRSYDNGGGTLGPSANIVFYGSAETWNQQNGANAVPTDLTKARINLYALDFVGGVVLTPYKIGAKGAIFKNGLQLTNPGAGQPLVVDNQGGVFSMLASSFGVNCFVDRESGGKQDQVIPPGGAVLTFGAQLAGPPFPPFGPSVVFGVSPSAGIAAVNEIPYISAHDNTGVTIGNDSAAPITVQVVWTRQQEIS